MRRKIDVPKKRKVAFYKLHQRLIASILLYSFILTNCSNLARSNMQQSLNEDTSMETDSDSSEFDFSKFDFKNTSLDNAVIDGKLDKAKQLSERGFNITKNKENKRILKKCYKTGNLKKLETLFEIGIHPDTWKNGDNLTLFDIACKDDNTAAIELMLKFGVDYKNHSKYASEKVKSLIKHHEEKIEKLKTISAKNIIHHICQRPEYNHLIYYYLKSPKQLEILDEIGLSPLHLALILNNNKILKLIKNKFPDYKFNTKCKRGISLIFMAYIQNKLNIFEFLLRSGASIKSQDNNDKSILHIAFSQKKYDYINIIFDDAKYRNLEYMEDEFSVLPYHLVHKGDLESLEFLSKGRIRFDIVNDKIEKTLLKLAYELGNFEIFQFLLKNKANPNQIYKKQILLHEACEDKKFDYALELLKYKSKYMVEDIKKMTPIEIAIKNKDSSLINFILKNKPNFDIDWKNHDGLTLLELAYKHRNFKAFELLLENSRNWNSTTTLESIYTKNDYHHLKKIIEKYDIEKLHFDNHQLLKHALKDNKLEIIKFILDKYLTQLNNNKWQTLIDTIIQYGSLEVYKHIEDKLNSKIQIKLTPLKNVCPRDKRILLHLANKNTELDALFNLAQKNNNVELLKAIFKNPNFKLKNTLIEILPLLHAVCKTGNSELILLTSKVLEQKLISEEKLRNGLHHFSFFTLLDNARDDLKIIDTLFKLKSITLLRPFLKLLNIRTIKDYLLQSYKESDLIFFNKIIKAVNLDRYKEFLEREIFTRACYDENLKFIRALLQYKISPNGWHDLEGRTLLEIYYEKGKWDMVEFLLKKGADILMNIRIAYFIKHVWMSMKS